MKLRNPEGVRCAQLPDSPEVEGHNVMINELDEEISIDEIMLALGRLKSGKADGIDGIPPEFFKQANEVLAPYLVQVFNNIFNKASFQKAWSRATIVLIYKIGNINDPGNHRGISLLSISFKVFMLILSTRLYNWIEDNNLLCAKQAGFRRNYSTMDHIFTIHLIVYTVIVVLRCMWLLLITPKHLIQLRDPSYGKY